jgi:hypothetical protein
MTFDASPVAGPAPLVNLDGCEGLSVCDLQGAERFLVWALRWESSVHDDPDFAFECLQESFDRAGLGTVSSAFRSYVAMVHGAPLPASPASRMGCWRINAMEASTLHAIACLQAGLFGDAWRTVSSLCTRARATPALLALGELAEELTLIGGQIRPWPGLQSLPRRRAGPAGFPACARGLDWNE